MEYFVGGSMVPEPKDAILVESMRLASQEHGIPYEVLRSVAYHESRYRPDARNAKTGASGIFQLLPSTAAGLGVDPFNVAQAASASAGLLRRWYIKYRRSWAHAFAAYVWGPRRVDNAGGYGSTNWPSKVRRYVQKVLEGAGMPVPFSPSQIVVNGRPMA